jgi:hypothetical protein
MELGVRVSRGHTRTHDVDSDAHRGNAKRFIVRVDEMLTAFVELQRAIHEFAVSLIS